MSVVEIENFLTLDNLWGHFGAQQVKFIFLPQINVFYLRWRCQPDREYELVFLSRSFAGRDFKVERYLVRHKFKKTRTRNIAIKLALFVKTSKFILGFYWPKTVWCLILVNHFDIKTSWPCFTWNVIRWDIANKKENNFNFLVDTLLWQWIWIVLAVDLTLDDLSSLQNKYNT